MTKAEAMEKIEALRREKTSHSKEEMSRLAWERYAVISQELESAHFGQYVTVEVDSGDYYVGRDPAEARAKAIQEHPDKAFHVIRIGYRAAGKWRGALRHA